MFNSIPLEMIQNPYPKDASTNSKKKTISVAETAEIEKAAGDRIKTLLKYLLKVGKSQKVRLKFLTCLNHVISTGNQMTNLVSNFEYLLLLCFLTAAEFWNFSTVAKSGPIQNRHWKLGQQAPSVQTILAYLETTA